MSTITAATKPGSTVGQADEFEVSDRRKNRYGVIQMTDWDTDEFRSLTPAHRCVYVTLCMYVGRYTQQCYPKIASIMQVTGISRATVFRALSELERVGLVERSKRFINPARKVNLYILK